MSRCTLGVQSCVAICRSQVTSLEHFLKIGVQHRHTQQEIDTPQSKREICVCGVCGADMTDFDGRWANEPRLPFQVFDERILLRLILLQLNIFATCATSAASMGVGTKTCHTHMSSTHVCKHAQHTPQPRPEPSWPLRTAAAATLLAGRVRRHRPAQH